MTLRELASKIPAGRRSFLLEGNVIYKSIADANDAHMKILVIIWKNYVDPAAEIDTTCTLCLNRILNNFKALQPSLIELEKENNLLNDC